jgi:hypothetical protein
MHTGGRGGSTYRKNTAFGFVTRNCSMGVKGCRIRVESCDELPLLGGREMILALDDDNLVCPDGVTQAIYAMI